MIAHTSLNPFVSKGATLPYLLPTDTSAIKLITIGGNGSFSSEQDSSNLRKAMFSHKAKNWIKTCFISSLKIFIKRKREF